MVKRSIILITRPATDAEDFVREVEASGFSTMIQSMLGIVAMDFIMPDPVGYGGLVFTSANAVRAFGETAWPREMPVFAVGAHTAAEAKKQLFRRVFSAEGDAGDLAGLIKKKSPDSATLLHVRGEHVARPLAGMLAKDRIEVDELVVYTTQTESNGLSDAVLKALREGEIAAVTFFSRRTAENFLQMAQAEEIFLNLSSTKALCISDEVLKCVQPARWGGAYSAARPDRAAMLELIKEICTL